MADPEGRARHYFDEDPDADSRPVEYAIDTPRGSLRVVSDAGVFSHGRLDRGTEVLLGRPELPGLLPESGAVLDLGCGAGPVALWIAHMRPGCTVWAVDTNERALGLTMRNARANGLTNIRVSSPDEVPAEKRFAAIVSNPPVRVGKPALQAMLRLWLARLDPGGFALLVMGRHLGADSLQKFLVNEGHPTTRIASSRGFRVLLVSPTAAAD